MVYNIISFEKIKKYSYYMQICIQSLLNIFNKSVTSCFSRFIIPKTNKFTCWNFKLFKKDNNLRYIIFSNILEKI